MPLQIAWPFPSKHDPKRLWYASSVLTTAAVGLFAKLTQEWLNNFAVYNKEVLIDALDNRPKTKSLLTISNHMSCIDDPVLWGMLGMRHLVNRDLMRWTPAAAELCFATFRHRLFFSLGKCVPIVRGDGVYQKCMNFCLEMMNDGGWVHTFPEGQVNETKENMRLKWGAGRLIADADECPVVIPIFHQGMNQVLPNKSPYIVRFRKKVTVLVGDPMKLDDVRDDLIATKKSPMEQRKVLSDLIQAEFSRMRPICEDLHAKHLKGTTAKT